MAPLTKKYHGAVQKYDMLWEFEIITWKIWELCHVMGVILRYGKIWEYYIIL